PWPRLRGHAREGRRSRSRAGVARMATKMWPWHPAVHVHNSTLVHVFCERCITCIRCKENLFLWAESIHMSDPLEEFVFHRKSIFDLIPRQLLCKRADRSPDILGWPSN